MMRILGTAAALAILSAATPALADLGGAQHAQRVVSELALKKAQARQVLRCQPRNQPLPSLAQVQAGLPTYPPVGVVGPIRMRGCPPDLPR